MDILLAMLPLFSFRPFARLSLQLFMQFYISTTIDLSRLLKRKGNASTPFATHADRKATSGLAWPVATAGTAAWSSFSQATTQ